MTRLSTGIDILDRRLNGGFPPGTLVALVAPPDTQSELLLSALARERPTRYVSTVRPAAEIEADLDATDLTVDRVTPEALLDSPGAYVDVGEASNVVVDPTTGLESGDRDAYVDALNALKGRLAATGSVGLLHCVDAEPTPRHRGLTLHRVDVVWRLDLLVTSLDVRTRLVVSKFRGGKALQEPIKLLLTDRVQVDTSRDIA